MFNKCAFPNAWRAADSEPECFTFKGEREAFFENFFGQLAMVGAAAFHQCDGLAEPNAVGGEDGLHPFINGKRWLFQ